MWNEKLYFFFVAAFKVLVKKKLCWETLKCYGHHIFWIIAIIVLKRIILPTKALFLCMQIFSYLKCDWIYGNMLRERALICTFAYSANYCNLEISFSFFTSYTNFTRSFAEWSKNSVNLTMSFHVLFSTKK